MLTESDDNVTITWVFNENGVPFISANVSTNCETSTGISSVYSSMTGTQVIKFTQKPPPDTRCTVTVHVANLLGSIDRQYDFTVPESKFIIYIRSISLGHEKISTVRPIKTLPSNSIQLCVSLTVSLSTCMSLNNFIVTQNSLSQIVKHQYNLQSTNCT